MVRFNIQKKDLLAGIILLAITIAFFSRLFYPHLSLFITPEYNGSDTTNFNIPVKLILSESLKTNTIPLWEKTIATGFPLLAESQIGYFYIPNYLLFKYINFPVAFNLGYILSFFLACSGMYALMRFKKFDAVTSLLCGFVFGFSGFFVGHMNHYNMLQAASLFPWLILIFEFVKKRGDILSVIVFSFVLSQQIFAGYAQITFITLLTITMLYVFDLLLPLKSIKRRIPEFIRFTILIGLGTFIGMILCSVSLLPTSELVKIVARPRNYDVLTASYFSFPFVQFKGFLSPFILGSPKMGTFPPPQVYGGTFFWETVQYIGLLPIIAISIFTLKNYRKKYMLALLGFIAFFVILMLGKFSPAYFVYSFPPFNIFRVPSRFILPMTLGLVFILGYAVRSIRNKGFLNLDKKKIEIVVVILFAITICDIFYYWFTYYPTVRAEQWMAVPELAEEIHKDGNIGRVMTPRGGLDKASVYGQHGWNNAEDYYLFSRNEMLPNSNSIWGISQLQGYTGLSTLKRHNLYEAVLEFATENRKKARPDILLDVSNVGYLIVSRKSDQPYQGMELMKTIKENHFGNQYLLYRNPSVLPRARIVTEFEYEKSMNDIIKKLLVMNEKLYTTALVEENPSIKSTPYSGDPIKVSWLEDANEYRKLTVDMPVDGLLILGDITDKNWHAYDNGKEARIILTNIIQQSIELKKGKHIVEFKYIPQSFYTGRTISIVAHIIVFAVFAVFALRNYRNSSPKA